MSQNPEQTIAELQKKIKDLELQLKKAKDSSGYGLKWEEKPEIFEERAQNALPLLKENKDLLIDNKSDLDHIIIEGDNYYALSALNYTHKGMIDVIYIDPPYNTGNKDFIYNDNYVDPEDAYRHSKWLSFMNKRLRLAKNLLSDDGVIFISIDDNEQANLKLLCDDIFGETNFLSNSFVLDNLKGKTNDNFITSVGSRLFVYSKNKGALPEKGFNKIENIFSDKIEEKYKLEDEIGFYNEITFKKTGQAKNREERPFMYYPILVKDNKLYSITEEEYNKIYNKETKNFDDDFVESLRRKYKDYEFILPYGSNGEKLRWTSGFNTFNIKKNEDIFYSNGIKQKTRPDSNEMLQIYASGTPKSLMYKPSYSNGTQELNDIFPESNFDFPKPVQLIKDILTIYFKNDVTILDFFAGSGTTGHAILDLNKQDGGHRQFILCSNRENTKEEPEKNICKNITYERVKRVLKGYTNSKGEKMEGLGGGNLRYYTTEFIEKKKSTDDLRQSFIYLCDELLCIKEDTFNEYKSELLSDKLKCYQKNNHYTVILYDIREIEKLQQLLSTLDGKISVYIFSLSKDSCEEELQEFSEKITIENIPDDILETYKKIF